MLGFEDKNYNFTRYFKRITFFIILVPIQYIFYYVTTYFIISIGIKYIGKGNLINSQKEIVVVSHLFRNYQQFLHNICYY
jgi:hypothetical protein